MLNVMSLDALCSLWVQVATKERKERSWWYDNSMRKLDEEKMLTLLTKRLHETPDAP